MDVNYSWPVKLLIMTFIVLNFLPGGFVHAIVNVDHFFASLHMFEYASYHNFLFGTDIIDNVGPYGYLHYPYTFSGGVFWGKILCFWMISVIYAYYATLISEKIQTWPERLLFLFTIVFFPLHVDIPWFAYEITPRLAVLFSALYFLTKSDKKSRLSDVLHIILNGLFYSFLVLEKAGNVYYLLLVIAILSAHWLIQRRWQNILWLVSTFCLGVSSLWLAAGQSLPGLFVYFQSMRMFIDAYQAILPIKTESNLLIYALFYITLSAVIMLFRTVVSFYLTRTLIELFRSLLISALIFLVWKHGIMRGSLSYGSFLYIMPCLLAYLYFYPLAGLDRISQPNRLSKYLSHHGAYIVRCVAFFLLLAIVFCNVFTYEHETNYIKRVSHEFMGRFEALIHYRPQETHHQLSDEYETLKHDHALPTSLKQKLRTGRVDEFGNSPEIILLNDLSYHPRPTPIHFIVGNAALNNKNGHFYQTQATAPDYVFLPDFGFKLTDTQAYLSILLNYHIIQPIEDWLVLKKKMTWQTIGLKELPEQQAHVGEWVSLQELQHNFLWAQIDMKPSILGQLKNFLYKSDFVIIELQLNNDVIQRYSISLSQLQSGLLLNPIIQQKTQLIFSYHEKKVPWNQVKAFRIMMDDPKAQRLFQPNFIIRFSNLVVGTNVAAPKVLDLQQAKQLMTLYKTNHPIEPTRFPVNVLDGTLHHDFFVDGLGELERNSADSWRWAVGPRSQLILNNHETTPYFILHLNVKNPLFIPQQSLTIYLNGKKVEQVKVDTLDQSEQTNIDVPIKLLEGVNTLKISYYDWNHKKNNYARFDPRTLAVLITRLELEHNNTLNQAMI